MKVMPQHSYLVEMLYNLIIKNQRAEIKMSMPQIIFVQKEKKRDQTVDDKKKYLTADLAMCKCQFNKLMKTQSSIAQNNGGTVS